MISIVSSKKVQNFRLICHMMIWSRDFFGSQSCSFITVWVVWKMIIREFFYSDTLWALMGAIKKWLGHTKRVPTTTSTGLISVIDKWNQEKFYFREKLTKKKIQSEKKSEKIRNFWRKITILEKCANFIIKKCIIFLHRFCLFSTALWWPVYHQGQQPISISQFIQQTRHPFFM